MRRLAWTGRPRRLVVGLTAVLALLPALPAAPAAADARAEQAEVRRKKVEAAARLDVLKASDQEVEEAMEALDASVIGTTDLVGEAVAAESRAALEAESADRQLAAGEERLRAAFDALRGQAIHVYTNPTPAALELSAEATPGDISRSMVYADVRSGQSADQLDKVRAARSDLSAARRRAARAVEDAAARRAATEARLTELEQTQAAQNEVAEALEAKVAANEVEVDQLAASDAELNAAIARQDAEAATRRRAELLAQQQAEAERAARLAPPPPPPSASASPSPAARRPGLAPGVLSPARPAAPGRPATPGPSRPVVSAPAGPGLTTVRGITVSSSIASQLASLLAASDGAGLSLSGGGYRSSQQQIQTRRSNCGASSYDIYEKPAGQCSPPTAKPGASMHERGLAVDFTNRGSIISSRSNPAFQWLAGNAGRFGFRNLPSEPWHWSTTGN